MFQTKNRKIPKDHYPATYSFQEPDFSSGIGFDIFPIKKARYPGTRK